MPHYYFDIDDHGFERDDLGAELSDAKEARTHAITYAGSLLRDEPGLVWDGREMSINVRDESGAAIASVHVRVVPVLTP